MVSLDFLTQPCLFKDKLAFFPRNRHLRGLPCVPTPSGVILLACLSLWLAQTGLTMLSPVAMTPSHHFVC